MTLSSSSFNPSTGTMTLDFEEVTSIEAGKPYIVKWPGPDKDIKNPIFEDVTISSQVKNIKTDAVTFCGTFDPIQMEVNDRTKLFMGDNNTLYYPDEEMTVFSFRAYFQLADGITAGDAVNGGRSVNTFVLNFDGMLSTGIIGASLNDNEEMINDKWFTIDGRRLAGKPTRKGVYVNDGHSVLIK